MITSVRFTKKFGYVCEKLRAPVKPTKPEKWWSPFCRTDDEKRKRNETRVRELASYECELEEYRKEYEYYSAHKGEYARQQLARNLLGRTFKFSTDKINVIFGPNASGKTTILKVIAGNAFVKDGYSEILEPMDYVGNHLLFGKNEQTYAQMLEKTREKWMKNSAVVKWDGIPIYYENFASKTGTSCGDLCGSVISGGLDELMYVMNKNRISQGQNSMFVFNRVMETAKHPMTGDSLFSSVLKKFDKRPDEDCWKLAAVTEYEYMTSLPNANSGKPNTFVFDEMDKSLDIENVIALYTKVLPAIIEQTGVQIITVSHSPVILSDAVFKSEKYNVISLDPEYTEKCRRSLSEMWKNN